MSIRHPKVLRISLQVAGAYAVLGVAWIFFSDRLLEAFRADAESMTQLQTYKGWFYVLLTAVLAFVLWYRSHAKIEETTRRVREERTHKHTMLRSIGDGVIATDEKEAIILMNPEAERLTGWNETSAMGRPLPKVFKILHGKTREPCQSPVQKVIQTGKVVGLANHTILVARNGREFQIADSGAPIFDDSGTVKGIILVFRDVTGDYFLQSELRRMRFAIEKASLGIFQLGEEGDILYANEAAMESLGYGAEEILKLTVADIDPVFDIESWKQHRAEILRDRGARTIKTRHRRKDGTTFPVEVQINYHEFEGERFSFSFAKDITQREEARKRLLSVNEELRYAKERAESSDRAKSEFLAVMSHELRTPLNPILGFTSVLQHEINKPQHREYLETIHTAGQRMLSMVEEILDYIQMDHDNLSALDEPVSILLTCRQAMAEVRSVAGDLHLELVDPDKAVAELEKETTFTGDARLLMRILTNLLSNACKFTPQGTVTLTVVPEKETDRPSLRSVSFVVEDSGIGIPQDKLEEVFQPFHQLDSSRTRRAQGLGMGLAICRKLVNLLGGEIHAESEVGKGSRFTVRIPFGVKA